MRCDGQKAVVIGTLVADDVAAEIEDRDVEKPLVDEIKQIQNTASTTVAVSKGMDGLELIVHHCKSDQRVDFFGFVNVTFPVGELVAQQFLSFRRRVDDCSCRLVHQRSAWC